jgi:hypothetical protein
MKSSELAQQQNYESDRTNTALRAMEHQADVQKSLASQGKVTYGTPYKKEGKMYRDKLVGGSVTGTETLGDAKIEDIPGKWFQSQDGQEIKYIPETDAPPQGWGPVADPGIAAQRDATTESTRQRIAQQQAAQQEKLATYKMGVEDPQRSIEERKIFADLFNSLSSDFEYVLEPKKGLLGKAKYVLKPKMATGQVATGSQVQAQSQPAQQQYTRENPARPQTQAALDALPAGSIFEYQGKLYQK